MLGLVLVTAMGLAAPASAYWSASGSAPSTTSTATLPAPIDVTVPAAAAPDVPVTWSAGAGVLDPLGWFVTRNTGAVVAPACASSPTALTLTTACTDTAVPDGSFTYVVTAVYETWTATGAPSGTVTVENATAVAFVDGPVDTLVGAAITPPVTVALRTAAGNPFPWAGVPITLTLAGPAAGVLGGTTTVLTDATGVATFADLTVSASGVGYSLTATGPGLSAATSDLFTVDPLPLLGAAQNFSLLAGTSVVNTGVSTVSGDVGVSPGTAVTGFPVGSVGGDIHAGDAAAAAARSALVSAYSDLKARTPTGEITTDLAGLVLTPGVSHSTAALALTGDLVLNAQGGPDAVFVFQSDAAFDTAAGSRVILINGARAANVYWAVTGAAGTGAGTSLSGSVLAMGAIVLGAGTELIGRALSTAAVSLGASTVRFTAALPPTIAITGGSAATTTDTTPTIAGTSNAPVSSPVTVRIAGQVLTTTVGTGGSWSVTAAEVGALSHQVVARVRDAAGNSTAATQVLTVEVNPSPVDLGAAESFAVLAATFVTSTGNTVVNGDLGLSPGTAVAGFPPGVVNGTIDTGSSAAAAQTALVAALDDAAGRAPHTEILGDLANRTFHMGVHHRTAALALTGTMTLDAQGDPDAVFIFQTDAAFDTSAGSQVLLTGEAQAANVYWVVAGAAGTGAGTSLVGTVLARGAISLGASTQLAGRALSRVSVTLGGNLITVPVDEAGRGAAAEPMADSGFAAAAPDDAAPTTAEDTALAAAPKTAETPQSPETTDVTTTSTTPTAPSASSTTTTRPGESGAESSGEATPAATTAALPPAPTPTPTPTPTPQTTAESVPEEVPAP